MSSLTPGDPPGTPPGSHVVASPGASDLQGGLTGPEGLPQQTSVPRGSGSDIRAQFTDDDSSEATPRAVKISDNQLYHVPQLQEPPKRRGNAALERRAPFQAEADVFSADYQVVGHALPPFAQLPDQSTGGTLGSVSGSITSSSLVSFAGSPLTPWDSNYPSPVEQSVPLSSRALRPTASSFEPLKVHSESSSAAQRGPCGPLVKVSALYPRVRLNPTGNNGATSSGGIGGLSGLTALKSSVEQLPKARDSLSMTPTTLAKHQPKASPGDAADGIGVGSKNLRPASPRTPKSSTATDKTMGIVSPINGHSNDKAEPCSPFPAFTNPDMAQYWEDPPVWTEKRHPGCFKEQRLNHETFMETFPGSFDVLATVNADHYSMPWRVSV